MRAVVTLDDHEIAFRMRLADSDQAGIFRRIVAGQRGLIILEFEHHVARARNTFPGLVLAAAYPPVTGDFCVAGARSDSLDRSIEDRFHMPDDLSLTIHVPVTLTFRTDKAIVQL